jgi:hypothetical protein
VYRFGAKSTSFSPPESEGVSSWYWQLREHPTLGAIHPVVNRRDRREPIFQGGGDCPCFAETPTEICGMRQYGRLADGTLARCRIPCGRSWGWGVGDS